MIDAKRLAEMMEPKGMEALAIMLDSLRISPTPEVFDIGDINRDTLDCAAAVLRVVANEHGWQSLDSMRETPRKPDEKFSAWHARCRVKMLKARVAERGDGKPLDAAWTCRCSRSHRRRSRS